MQFVMHAVMQALPRRDEMPSYCYLLLVFCFLIIYGALGTIWLPRYLATSPLSKSTPALPIGWEFTLALLALFMFLSAFACLVCAVALIVNLLIILFQ